MSDKPKFDPSKPFEAVADGPKPKFDPSKPFEEARSSPERKKLSDEELKSAGTSDRGVLGGLYDAFLSPEGESIGEKVPIIGPLGRRLGEGFRAAVDYASGNGKGSLGETYDAIRAENDARNAEFAKAHPGADLTRTVVGAAGGLGISIPGAAGAKPVIDAAGTIVGRTAVKAMPGLAGVGTRMLGSGALASSDVGLRTGDANKATQAFVLGAALQGGLETLPATAKVGRTFIERLKASGQKFDEFANTRAIKAATGQNKAALKKIARTKGFQNAGDALLAGENPVVQFGSSVDTIRDRAATAADKAWNSVEEVYKAVDKTGIKVQGGEVAKAIRQHATKIEPLPQNESVISSLEKTAQYFEGKGEMSLAHTQELKNNFLFKLADPRSHALGTDGNNAVREAITGTLDKTIRKADPKLAKVWRDAMDDYGVYAETAGAASDRAIANVSNRLISPSDYAIGSTTALYSAARQANSQGANEAIGGIIGAVAAMTHKLVRERGSSMAAASAKRLASVLETAPESLGEALGAIRSAVERGPAALEATHLALLKTDENYRKAVQPEPEPTDMSAPMVGPKSDVDERRKAIQRRLSE